MPIFTIFNHEGESERLINCIEIDLLHNMQAGEKYILGEYQNHYLVNNQPVEKPPRPSDFHNWDTAQKAWFADLDGAKAAMWRKIQDERTRRMAGGYPVVFNGQTWWLHSDTASLSQQQGLVQMAQLVAMQKGDMNQTLTQWKTMGGSFVNMTPNFALAMFQAGMVQQQAIFTAAETHKAKMRASADPWNYDFSADWPKIYGEE